MSNRTYSKCPMGHRMSFDPGSCTLIEWWCPSCQKSYKFTPKERKMVLVAYRYGIERGKREIIESVKDTLHL